MNSNIKESDFARKKLNLVIVLDISGSMGSPFNSYYYDNLNVKSELSVDKNKSKMQIANEAVNILIDQLKEDDRFGVVLFDDSAYLGKPISLVAETDIEAIKGHILEIEENGGTNFEAGYEKGTKLFDEYLESNQDEYENRIIFLTDAMPNVGTTSKEGLLGYVSENADKNIYTTFIGIGVDFNTEVIEAITKVRGANYYSVHNSKEFKERVGEQFEYMVTPLVFDLSLDLKSDGYSIEAVYGSPEADMATGNIMHVNTLFPSKSTDEGEVKGGLVLLKLRKKANAKEEMTLSVSYKDRNGESYSNSQSITIEDKVNEYYPNTGIRKGIVLTRYVNMLKNWMMYERTTKTEFVIEPNIGIRDFIYTEEQIRILLGENERQSTKLSVSGNYKEIFIEFREYLQAEITEIGDETMSRELELLNLLIGDEANNTGNKSQSKLTGNVYRVGCFNDISANDSKKVLSNYNDFKSYFNKYTNYTYNGQGKKTSGSSDPILNKYNESFFKNKSLAVVYVSVSSGSAIVEYEGSEIQGNAVLIKYEAKYPGVGTDDMSGYFVIVEVDKNITSII